MGKGYRNRDERNDLALTKSKKQRRQKRSHHPLPKWLIPVLLSVAAVAVVFAIVFTSMASNGTFKRNNILVKSQTKSKYSINEYTAQILLWISGWEQGSEYYTSMMGDSSSSSDNSAIATSLNVANYNNSHLNDAISDNEQMFIELTALCDWGIKNNVTPLTKDEEDQACDSWLSELRSEAKSYYKYGYEVGFPSTEGEDNEMFPYDYSSYVDDSNYPYFLNFIASIFGNGIKTSDIRRTAIIVSYANRVKTLKQAEYWEADQAVIDAELKKNPDQYYSLDYVSYKTDDAELAASLQAATDVNDFKKIIAAYYVANNYFGEYNKELATRLQEKLEGKTGEELTTALTENNLTIADYVKPAEGATIADGLTTKEQTDWLFDDDRTENEIAIVTEKDDSATLMVITKITKDETTGNVTSISAAFKNYAEILGEEKQNELIEKVYVSLELADAAEEAEAETETDEEETATDTTWDNLLASMKEGADDELYGLENSQKYVKSDDLKQDIEDVKTALEAKETEEDKASYMTEQNASSYAGISEEDAAKYPAELKAILFPEENTVANGLTQIITIGTTKHLIYVSKVETQDEKTLVSFYDYSDSDAFKKWLFAEVNEEDMTGSPAVGSTYVFSALKEQTVYLVTNALGLGEDVVRGGFAAFSNGDDARSAKDAINGLSGIALLNELAKINSNTVASESLTADTAEANSPSVKDWLFADGRVKNDVELILPTDSVGNVTGYYVAVFLNKVSTGESAARTNYSSAAASEWATSIATEGGYQLSQSALKKIKNTAEPTTEESEGETDGSAEATE